MKEKELNKYVENINKEITKAREEIEVLIAYGIDKELSSIWIKNNLKEGKDYLALIWLEADTKFTVGTVTPNYEVDWGNVVECAEEDDLNIEW